MVKTGKFTTRWATESYSSETANITLVGLSLER